MILIPKVEKMLANWQLETNEQENKKLRQAERIMRKFKMNEEQFVKYVRKYMRVRGCVSQTLEIQMEIEKFVNE